MRSSFTALLAGAVLIPVLATAAFAQSAPAATAAPAETKEQKDARMKWWREARFGMFIHWGIYSVPAGVYQGRPISNLGEWIQNYAKIPSVEYKKYADQFNPTKFSADDFVKTAKDAGMKYIVITSKHHDGFAMFKSADPFNVVDATPFKRDIIKELSDAAHRQGVHFGVYYSQMQDWNHPGGDVQGGGRWDQTMAGSLDDYIAKVAIPQVKELFTNIKPEVLWWDTPGRITKAQATPLHDLLALDPNIVTNNRLGGGFQGDTETPEQNIPATGFPGGRDWETCMTINGTWGYKSTDTNFKPTQTLLRNLIDIASKGGNYLLNVGPTAEGLIPQPEIDRLAEMGKWLQVNGEAIYATGPNPFVRASAAATSPASAPATTSGRGARGPAIPWDWRATTKLNPDGSGKVYVHILEWPADGKLVLSTAPTPESVQLKITNAYLLADPAHKPVEVSRTQMGMLVDNITLKLPAAAPDPIASVVVLEVKP